MADDIVTRLRAEADAHADGDWNDQVIRRRFTEAAAEIERLRAEVADWRLTVQAQEAVAEALRAVVAEKHAEIERLRDAGDEMAEALHGWCNGMDAFTDDAERVRAWKEARRG